MAYKQFIAGEEALAADVNSYLMSQTVARFPTAANRTTQLPSPVLNQLSALDTAPGVVQYWDGSAWQEYAGPPWLSYTPPWLAASTNPTIGNGTIVGRYWLRNKTCGFRIVITFGSTTNGGTGAYTFGLPFQAASLANQYVPGAFYAGAGFFQGLGLIVGGTGNLSPYAATSGTDTRLLVARNADSSGAVGTGIPTIPGSYSYLTGNYLAVQGVYEIGP
jgi:hypothetical protein